MQLKLTWCRSAVLVGQVEAWAVPPGPYAAAHARRW